MMINLLFIWACKAYPYQHAITEGTISSKMCAESIHKFQGKTAPTMKSSVKMDLGTCMPCEAGKDTENEQHGDITWHVTGRLSTLHYEVFPKFRCMYSSVA